MCLKGSQDKLAALSVKKSLWKTAGISGELFGSWLKQTVNSEKKKMKKEKLIKLPFVVALFDVCLCHFFSLPIYA